MVRVKICGITSTSDAAAAAKAGADAIGLVFAKSPRKVTKEQARAIAAALPPFVAKVGVFVDEPADVIVQIARFVGLAAVQVHDDRPPEEIEKIAEAVSVIKAFRVRDRSAYEAASRYEAASAYLFDAYVNGIAGGTGKSIERELLPSIEEQRSFARPWILAGGLSPENVEDALESCYPYAVDVSSGVEASPGQKDEKRVREFVARVRGFERGERGTLWAVRR